MDEAASVCDRVVVLTDGEVRHVGRVDSYDGASGLAELLQAQSATPS
jgi:ABC-type Na+ transport system ATPase subunit NatA